MGPSFIILITLAIIHKPMFTMFTVGHKSSEKHGTFFLDFYTIRFLFATSGFVPLLAVRKNAASGALPRVPLGAAVNLRLIDPEWTVLSMLPGNRFAYD